MTAAAAGLLRRRGSPAAKVARYTAEADVGARERLDDGQAEEDVSRGYPALRDDVLAPQGDHQGPLTEDHDSG